MIREATEFVEPIMQMMYDNYWGKQIIEFSGLVDSAVSKQDPDRLLRYLERMGVKAMPMNAGSGWVQMVTQISDPYKKKFDEVGDITKATFKNTSELVSNKYTWDSHKILASSYTNLGNHQMHADIWKTDDPTRDYLLKLGVRFDDPADYVESKPYPNGIPGAKVKLTDDEWDQFHTSLREGVPEKGMPSMRTQIEAMINAPGFKTDFTTEEQGFMIQKAIPRIRELHRTNLLSDQSDLSERFGMAVREKTKAVEQARAQGLQEVGGLQ
jgi:hypothetical protein